MLNKDKRIDELYNILIQYEKIDDEDSIATECSYKNYLDRLYVWYIGDDNQEIATVIKGLYELGADATHSSVKRSVFHMIDLIKKARGA